MIYYCPQCGARVLQGALVCPQCGAELKFVIQTGGNNTAMNDSLKATTPKKKNAMGMRGSTFDSMDYSEESATGPVLKYNEYADPNNVKDPITDNDEMTIFGLTDNLFSDDYEGEFNADKQQHFNDIQNKTVIGNIPSSSDKDASGMGELSRYKIITQVFDKKLGFNAKDLETKLNMYAKLGYHLVPNTMICQPGQDFFALMERTTPDASYAPSPVQPQPISSSENNSVAEKPEEKL